MKKYLSRFSLTIIAAGLFPFMSGCVTDQDFRGLELQLRSMDNRVVELEKELEELQNKAGTTVEVMRKQQAGLGSNVDRLNTELLQVKGQLDESRHRYRSLQSENQKLQDEIAMLQQNTKQQADSLQERITSVESSTSEIDTRLASVHSNLAEMKEEQAKAAALAAELARKKAELARQNAQPHEIAPAKSKKTPGTETTVEHSEETASADQPKSSQSGMYDQALDLFKAQKYKDSQELFSQFIKKNPNDKLAVNARFWVGDCLYNQNEFALAILEYQNVIADYPNHSKAPAALFKQGMAFENLQDVETSKIVYKKILSEYPNSDQVDAAKKRLQILGN